MKKLVLVGGGILAVVGVVLGVLLVAGVDFRSSPTIGSVDTEWKLIGTDSKVAIDAFDDPKVKGVSCFISRARAGGISGGLGINEDPSGASIACRQIGPISFVGPIENGELVFTERRSLIFKALKVARFHDPERRTLVYLTFTTRVIDGSKHNAVSAVPLMPWNGVAATDPVME